MPSADQAPVNSTHSTMRWPEWVVLIAGRPALHYVLFALSNRHITPDARRDLFHAASATLAPGHHCPSHSGHLVGKRDGSNLGGPPRQQRRKPRPMLGTVELRIADHGERTGCEQAAQITIALFADAAELVFAPTRVLLRNQPDPGREIPSRSKRLGIGNACDKSSRQRRTDARDRVEPLACLV